MKIKNENFITITGWMVTELKLKGNELLVYAIIYGFSQTEGQTFSGSLQYLADWTNSTKQGVIKCLKSLLEKGYIQKKENIINGVKFCEYHATEFNGGMQQSLTGYATEFNGGMQQSLPNNIDNNIEDKIDNNIDRARKRFTPPTLEDVQAYCNERNNNVDAYKFIDYYSSNGWKVGKNPMKDWRAAVRTWERNTFGKPANRMPLPDYMRDQQEKKPAKTVSPEKLAEIRAKLNL